MVRVCFIWLDSLAAVSRSVADDNANQSNVESIDARLCALRIVKEEQMRYGGSLLLLVGHTNAVTTLAPTITPPPTSACRPTLAMARRSIRANVTVTVEAANTPLADIDYVQDSSYELYEYETADVVTHYTCDEASEAGFSCAEFERQAYEACDGCACAGQAPRCEYWDRENVRCQKTYGDRFADKLWALAACDADPRCVAVTEVATASGRAADRYDLCKHAPHRDPHDACGTGDFANGHWGRTTFVCGQLCGFQTHAEPRGPHYLCVPVVRERRAGRRRGVRSGVRAERRAAADGGAEFGPVRRPAVLRFHADRLRDPLGLVRSRQAGPGRLQRRAAHRGGRDDQPRCPIPRARGLHVLHARRV